MKNNVHENAVAFIVVRVSSSRLPGKHFRTIGNKSLLSRLTGHLQSCREVDEIVIATVAEAVNEPLRDPVNGYKGCVQAVKKGEKVLWYYPKKLKRTFDA